MAKRATRRNLNNLLFSFFWWFIQLISPKQGDTLLYWGLQSGAFPNTSHFDPSLAIDVIGHHFNTPIGIGSSFDTKATVIDDLIFMGASFGELGPYTLEAETPTTETFYLRKDLAIVVQSLGYKNNGILKMVPTFVNRRYLPNFVGINVTTTAPSEGENIKMGKHMSYEAEFKIMLRKIASFCDYITLDFSNSNIELSHLVSDNAMIVPFIQTMKETLKEAAPYNTPKLLLKIPFDATPLEMPLICKNIVESNIDAVIIGGPVSLFHTPIKLSKPIHMGGVLGKPTHKYITEKIARIYHYTEGKVPIIAYDGVFSGKDAYHYLSAGASLVQINSAIRFEGPGIITRINRELAAILRGKGVKSVKDIIGSDFK